MHPALRPSAHCLASHAISALGVCATAVLIGSMMRFDIPITLDGSAAQMSSLKLAACTCCALRPDRLLHMLRTMTEHRCIKDGIEASLKRQFDRLCVLPEHLNKCFDWDLAGTRWQRVGISLAEAYKALGLPKGAGTKDVKAAYHRAALANHPDKVGMPGTAAAEEASLTFMKAQKAFEKIMDHRKPPSPPPAQPTPPTRPRSSPASSRSSSGRASSKRRTSGAKARAKAKR